jgi:hypothetical protein
MSFVQDGTCSDEKKPRGKFGPVQGGEMLARIVKSPEHFNRTGQIKPGLFPKSHITKSGLSITRLEKIKDNDFKEYCNAVAEMKEGQKLAGIRKVLTSRIWQILNENRTRAFCVIEDPAPQIGELPANEAHAVAVTSLPVESDDEIIRLQTELTQAFSELLVI